MNSVSGFKNVVHGLVRILEKSSNAVGAMALLSIVLAPVSMAGASPLSPYSGSGFDVSYPQCSVTSYPNGFAIVGLGGGRPFTTSTCFAAQWSAVSVWTAKNIGSATPTTPSLYFNTGYAVAYAKEITATCKTAATNNVPIAPGTSSHLANVETQAWEIGCSEADYAASVSGVSPSMWWADVESGNSWSTNQSYNQFTIDGLAYQMSVSSSSTPWGFYSTTSSWDKLVGSTFIATPSIYANWQPGSCGPSSAFSSGASLWLAQSTGTVGGLTFDLDTAC